MVAISVVMAIVLGAYFLRLSQNDNAHFSANYQAPASTLANGSESVLSEGSADGRQEDRSAPLSTSDGGENGMPVIDLMAITGPQEILDQLGIDRDFEEWARRRGFTWVSDPAESPYSVLTMEELEELADAGDKDAELALADKLRESDPLAALDRVQQLAMDGKIEAMAYASVVNAGIDNLLNNPGASNLSAERLSSLEAYGRQGMDSEIESMAWGLLYDSYMGYPREMGNSRIGDPASRFRQACDRAVELRRFIEAQAQEQGRSMPPLESAPFGIGSLDIDATLLTACPDDLLPSADFSSCRPIQVYLEGQYFDAYVCP